MADSNFKLIYSITPGLSDCSHTFQFRYYGWDPVQKKNRNRMYWQGYLNNVETGLLPWDSSANGGAGGVASTAPTTWTVIIPRDSGISEKGYVKVIVNRTNQSLTFQACDASGNVISDASDPIGSSRTVDISSYEYSNHSGSNYASLNEMTEKVDIQKELLEESVVKPSVTSVALTAAQTVSVSWSAVKAENSADGRAPSLKIQYSKDPTFVSGVGEQSLSPTWDANSATLEGTSSIGNLDLNSTYYFRIVATWTDGGNTAYSNGTFSSENSAGVATQQTLGTPSNFTMNVTDEATGSGTLTWNSVNGAGGYQYQTSSDGVTWGTASGSGISGTTLTFSNLAGKWIRVQALASVGSAAYSNSGWSEGQEVPEIQIEYNDTRVPFFAIPSVEVDYVQIHKANDVITKAYADAHYSGNAVSVSQLPTISVYNSSTAATDDSHVVTPKYVESRVGSLSYNITQIAVSSANGAKTFNGVQLGSGESATSTTSIKLASKKYIEDTFVAKSQYADYSAWNSTDETTVANPNYVKQAIEGYVADTSKVTVTGGSGKGGMIVKLDANGKLDDTVLPDLAITNITVVETKIHFGGTSEPANRAAAITANLPTSGVQKGDTYIFAPTLTEAEQDDGNYLVGTFLYTGSAWKEAFTPNAGINSVNGKYGPSVTLALTDIYANGSTKVTIDSSISTSNISTENYHFPTSKAVQGYVSTVIANLSLGDAATYSVATWTDGTTKWNTGGTGLVTANYLKSAITDYGFGTAATAAISTQGVKDGESGLVTGDQVYDYQPLLSRSKWNNDHAVAGVYVNQTTEPQISSENYYIASAYSVKKWIDAAKYTLPKASKTTLGGVYFPDLGEDNKINGLTYDASSGALSMAAANGTSIGTVFTNANSGISIANGAISIAAATSSYLGGVKVGTGNGLTFNSSKLQVSLANGTNPGTVKQGTDTGVTIASGIISVTFSTDISTDATSDVKAATPKAVKTYVDGASYAIDAFTNGTNGKGKVVKTLASGVNAGYISPDLIPIDEQSIVLDSGLLCVDSSYLEEALDLSQYLTTLNAQNTYLKRQIIGVPAWVQGNNYAVGDVVFYQGRLYRCTATDNASSAVVTSGVTAKWTEVTLDSLNRYETTIPGDGSTTLFTVTHNLGVKDVNVTLIDASTDQEVFAAVTMYSATQVKIGFGAAPASGKVYRVIVKK